MCVSNRSERREPTYKELAYWQDVAAKLSGCACVGLLACLAAWLDLFSIGLFRCRQYGCEEPDCKRPGCWTLDCT